MSKKSRMQRARKRAKLAVEVKVIKTILVICEFRLILKKAKLLSKKKPQKKQEPTHLTI